MSNSIINCNDVNQKHYTCYNINLLCHTTFEIQYASMKNVTDMGVTIILKQ